MPQRNPFAACLLGLAMTCTLSASGETLNVGVGKCVITPVEPMWMAGYASRTAPSEGKIHDLYAKALAFEDETGAKSVIVTSDLLGIPANVAHAIAALALERWNIPRERLALSASHTHSGPVIRDGLLDMYGLDEAEAAKVKAYTEALPGKIGQAIEAALADLEPCTVQWGIGEASFAGNRRKYTLGGVQNDFNPIGPVDHDVPVLAARPLNGPIKAVLFGYACHCTTTADQQFYGDYAGFAQIDIEAALPGAVALFATGCGGDQNPYPRRELALAEKYGKELASGVIAALNADLSRVTGPIRAVYTEIPLALSEPPTREQLVAQAADGNVYIQRRAQRLLRTLDEKGALDTTYPYPVQVWQFADSLQMTMLAGEVVVDYALRLKHELGREKQFVMAYTNDVFAYIPSLRVLREGGYEGDTSMIYYGLYGPWAPTIEEDIINAVHALSKKE